MLVAGVLRIGSGLYGAEYSTLRQILHCSVDNEFSYGVNCPHFNEEIASESNIRLHISEKNGIMP